MNHFDQVCEIVGRIPKDLTYYQSSHGDMPKEVRERPYLAIARPPSDLEVLRDLRSKFFFDMTIPPISARVEMGQLLSRSFHEEMLERATADWVGEVDNQAPLGVSDDELTATAVLGMAAVADLRNLVAKLTKLHPMRLGKRYTIVVPKCNYDDALEYEHPTLANRKLYKSDLLAICILDNCRKSFDKEYDILSVETFSKPVVYGTDMVYTNIGYWETSKITGRRQARLDTKRYAIELNDDTTSEWPLLPFVNILQHFVEDFKAFMDSGAPSLIHTMQTLEDIVRRLEEEKKAVDVNFRHGLVVTSFPASTADLHVSDDGLIVPRNPETSIAIDMLVFLGIIGVDVTLRTRWSQYRTGLKLAVGRDALSEVFLILDNLTNVLRLENSVSPENAMCFAILCSFTVDARTFSGDEDAKLALNLDANWYANRVSGLLFEIALDLQASCADGEEDGFGIAFNSVVEKLSRDLPDDQARWMRVLLELEHLPNWESCGLRMGSKRARHADAVTDRASWVEKSARLKFVDDAILVGEESTMATKFKHQETGQKYMVTCRDGKFVWRKIGMTSSIRRLYYRGGGLGVGSTSASLNSTSEADMTNEEELLSDMIAGRCDVEGQTATALWAVAAILKGQIRVSRESRKWCRAHSENGPKIRCEIPAALAKRFLLGETRDGKFLWMIGGGYAALELKFDGGGLEFWEVTGNEIPDVAIPESKKGVMKFHAVIR